MSLDLKTNFPQINLSLVKGRNCLVYTFDNFELKAEHLMLYCDGQEVSLTPKQVETLLALVERAGAIVTKEVLMSRLWGDSSVEESNLIQNVHLLRKVLGKTSTGKPMIETFRRRGYRFNGELLHAALSEDASSVTQPGEIETGTSNNPKLTKRRKGLLRGAKIMLLGLCLGFVFLILLQALMIFGSMLSQYTGSSAADTASPTLERIGNLLVMVTIPVGLGWFTGIGLFLFGAGRVVYGFFEKEEPKIRPVIVERVLAGIIVLVILAVAIPNLMFAYEQANRARQIRQASTEGKRSIAVLPLKPIDPSSRNDDYEIGIAASLIQKLSSVRGFVVRQLSATRMYTHINQDALAAGREQKVEYVFASNYQLANGRIRVTSQLLDVANERVEETYSVEADTADLFSAQDSIANDLGRKLLAKFGYDVISFDTKAGTNNQEAYRLYLRAMNLSEERGVQNILKSLECLDQAVSLDANYALAWAAKARTHADLVAHTDSDQQVNYYSSMDAIAKALAIDPDLSEAYSALCQNKNRYEYDASGAEAACKRAVELDPNSPVAHKTYANFLYSRGRFEQAMDEIKTATILQPVSYRNQQMSALTLYFAGHYEEAEAQFKTLLELSPNHTYIHGRLVIVLQEEGKESEAFEYLMKKLTLEKADSEIVKGIQTAYETSGWSGVVAERIRVAEAAKDSNYFQLACLYAKLGDKDNAFANLEKAYQQHSSQIAVLTVEPQLDSLHSDSRFDDLVRRVEGK